MKIHFVVGSNVPGKYPIFSKKIISLDPKCSNFFVFKYFYLRFTQLHDQVWNVRFRGVLWWWEVPKRGTSDPGFDVNISSDKSHKLRNILLGHHSCSLPVPAIDNRETHPAIVKLSWLAYPSITLLTTYSTLSYLRSWANSISTYCAIRTQKVNCRLVVVNYSWLCWRYSLGDCGIDSQQTAVSSLDLKIQPGPIATLGAVSFTAPS